MIIEQITEGIYTRIRWRIVSINEDIWLKFPYIPSIAELQNKEKEYLSNIQYRDVAKLEIKIEEEIETIKKIITQIKSNPTTTLTQLNTYLATLQWYEEYTIRFFIFVFGKKLAEKKDVSIGAVTANAFWVAVRDFIVSTPSRKLAKLIIGQDVTL